MSIINFSIDNELIGARNLGTNVHRHLKSTLTLNTFKSFKTIDQLNQQSLFNHNHFTSRLPFVLTEQEFDLTKTNLNKVFTSQWLDDRKIIMGTKCNKIVILDTITGQHSIQNPIEPHPNSKNIQNHCGIHAISINPSRTLLATGAQHVNDIGIYTLPDLEPLACGYNAHSYWIFDIVWLDDQHVVSGAGDNRLALWTINFDNKNENSRIKFNNNYVNKNKKKKNRNKNQVSKSANSSFAGATSSSSTLSQPNTSPQTSWFNFVLNRNSISSQWRDRRFIKRPNVNPSFSTISSTLNRFHRSNSNEPNLTNNNPNQPTSSRTLNNSLFRHRFNFRYDLTRSNQMNSQFNIYNINNNNNFNRLPWRSRSIFQTSSSHRNEFNNNDFDYDNDFFDINEEERDNQDSQDEQEQEMDDSSFIINYENNTNTSSDIEIFNNSNNESDSDFSDEEEDDDDEDNDDSLEFISDFSENGFDQEQDISNDTDWTSPSSSRSQPALRRRNDSNNDDFLDLSHLKRRRLNMLGKFKCSNGNSIKYKMPTKIIKCKQSKRIRALAYNPKRNEIAAISMNAAFHYFDVRRFEQKYTKKLSPLKENVCLTIDNDYSIYAIGSASHVQLLDANNARPLTNPIFVKKDIGIRSLHFRNSILSIGTGIGTVLFYDLRAKNFLNYGQAQTCNSKLVDFNYNSENQFKLQTNGGWILRNETYYENLPYAFNTDNYHAIYSHSYDPTGTKLLTAGGPLTVNLYGHYVAVWR